MEGDRPELPVGQEARRRDERDQHPVHPSAPEHHRILQPLHGQKHAADRAGVLQRYDTHPHDDSDQRDACVTEPLSECVCAGGNLYEKINQQKGALFKEDVSSGETRLTCRIQS